VASGISEARSKARNLACDGVVLVVTAGQTRREVALHARDELKGGEAPLLGTILAGRRFPIPEAIYRRL
jgi:Mrp family chromosome partitioning ATPase